MSSDRGLGRTFDGAAASYHDARPSYPDRLFDDLHALLPTNPRVLEIGPGTGHATEPMLDRGAWVRAIEIGPRLAVELARRLGRHLATGHLEVVVADYERLDPDGQRFDAVVCATAYHWVSPDLQLSRPPQWLEPNGVLAVIDTVQVASEVDEGYFDEVGPIYERHGQGGGHRTLPEPDDVTSPIWERMQSDASCVDVKLRRYRWDQRYDTTSYRALLGTYSGMLAMDPEPRERLIADLLVPVEARGGQITRPLVMTLATCRFVR